ncbi:MAG: hypothetical protein V1778_03780 [bacterium]
MAITPKEFDKIQTIVTQVVTESAAPMRNDIRSLKQQVGSLTDDVDQFLHIVRNHEQE